MSNWKSLEHSRYLLRVNIAFLVDEFSQIVGVKLVTNGTEESIGRAFPALWRWGYFAQTSIACLPNSSFLGRICSAAKISWQTVAHQLSAGAGEHGLGFRINMEAVGLQTSFPQLSLSRFPEVLTYPRTRVSIGSTQTLSKGFRDCR